MFWSSFLTSQLSVLFLLQFLNRLCVLLFIFKVGHGIKGGGDRHRVAGETGYIDIPSENKLSTEKLEQG